MNQLYKETGRYLCSSGFLATTNQVRVVSLYASVRPSLRPGRARGSPSTMANLSLKCSDLKFSLGRNVFKNCPIMFTLLSVRRFVWNKLEIRGSPSTMVNLSVKYSDFKASL